MKYLVFYFCFLCFTSAQSITFEKILKECWNGEKQIFNFTNSYWQELDHSKQMDYAKKYQVWFSNKIGVKTCEIITKKDVTLKHN